MKAENLDSKTSLLQFWSSNLQSAIPLLADDCKLAIPAVRQALQPILTVLEYQLIKLTLTQSQPNASNLTSPVITILQQVDTGVTVLTQGVNFNTLHTLAPHTASITSTLFNDAQSFYTLLGVLVGKTKLPIAKLTPLVQWVTTLSLAALAGFVKYVRGEVSQAHVTQWLLQQPSGDADETLLMAVGFDSLAAFNQRLQLHQMRVYPASPSALSANTTAQPWLVSLTASLEGYTALRPFTIVPGRPTTGDSALQRPINTANNRPKMAVIAPAYDVFAPINTKPTWAERLQKHWMLTAALASTVVFGGLGAILSKPASAPVVASTASPQPMAQKPSYHDVAIVRVASLQSDTQLASSTVDSDTAPAKVASVSGTLVDKKSAAKESVEKATKNKATKADLKDTTTNTTKKASDSDKTSKNADKKAEAAKKASTKKQANKKDTANKDTNKQSVTTSQRKKSDQAQAKSGSTSKAASNKPKDSKLKENKKDTHKTDTNNTKTVTKSTTQDTTKP